MKIEEKRGEEKRAKRKGEKKGERMKRRRGKEGECGTFRRREEEEERIEKQRDISEEVIVCYEKEITLLHTALVVAGLHEVAKAGLFFEDLRKFPDAKEKKT